MKLGKESPVWRSVYQSSRPEGPSWNLRGMHRHPHALVLASHVSYHKRGMLDGVRERYRTKLEHRSQEFADLIEVSAQTTGNTAKFLVGVARVAAAGVGISFFIGLVAAAAFMLF